MHQSPSLLLRTKETQMQPKPDFLGDEIAAAFQDAGVAAAYQHRPPYPPAVFDILATLVVSRSVQWCWVTSSPSHATTVGGEIVRHGQDVMQRDASDATLV